MNGRECCRAMRRGETCDFLPRTPILMQYAAACIGSHYGAFASDHRVLVEANRRASPKICAPLRADSVEAVGDRKRIVCEWVVEVSV